MSRDLQTLLRDAAPEPTMELDESRLVDRALRQRMLLRAGTSVAAAVVVVAAVLFGLQAIRTPGGLEIVGQPGGPSEPAAVPRDLMPADAIEIGSGSVFDGDWQAHAWVADELICVEVTAPIDSGRTCGASIAGQRVLALAVSGRERNGRLRPGPWVAGQVSADVETLTVELDNGDTLQVDPTPIADVGVVGVAFDHDRYPVRARAFNDDGRLLTTHVFENAGPGGTDTPPSLPDG